MSIFKCKMCGGTLEISDGSTVATCEYCGTTQTLPRLDDDKRANLYDRANHFRRNNEFDKAMSIYEQILNEDGTDAEAYWSLVLCRYGIEYVEDPATHKRVPTVNRAQFTSIFDDDNYKSALAHADSGQRAIYEAEAAAINEIQKGILAISQKEEPFDVFICYKETDNNGRRTQDSVLANDLYHQLTQEGFKVFFSRITLEDKLGTAYEPYIFAALNSAKVMVVLGTRPEHFNAVWVKNEWSRYLALIKNGAQKVLIPAYRDMDPYDLPEEFSHLQAQDMSKLGFMQDLIRGIKKLAGTDEPKTVVKETTVVQSTGGSNADALLDRGYMALEDGDWAKADDFFEQVLNQDARNARAYLGKFLAKGRHRNLDAFREECTPDGGLRDDLLVEDMTIPVDQDRIDKMCARAVPGYLTAADIQAQYQFDDKHITMVPGRIADKEEFENSLHGDKDFTRALQYADSALAAQISAARDAILAAHQSLIDRDTKRTEGAMEELKKKYADFLDRADQKSQQLIAEAEQRRENDYQAACKLQAEGTEEALRNAAVRFASHRSYKDAEKRIDACYAEADRLKEQAEAAAKAEADRQAAEKAARAAEQKKKTTRLTIIASSAAAIIVAATLLITKVILPAVHYSDAEKLLAAGQYEEAIAAFEALGYYRDAPARIEESKNAAAYAQVEALLQQGETAAAAVSFGAVGDYKDARARSFALWDEIALRDTISAGYRHTVGVKADGTVVAVGDNKADQCDVDGCSDIVAVAAGGVHTVCLKADGTMVTMGYNSYAQRGLNSWKDIVAISVGDGHTVGLKLDGTVVAEGNSEYRQCNVGGWKDIVAIAAGGYHTVGLKSDGTVEAVGNNDDGQCDVDDWADIVAVAAGSAHTVGLKSDGTVVAVGWNEHGQCGVSSWRNIVAIAAGGAHTVGLKSDGAVVAAGFNNNNQCDVGSWTDIVAVAAGSAHTIGLKSDGTVVAVGGNYDGQCNVNGWTDIKLPNR